MARVISYLFSAQIVAMILGAPISTMILDHASWFGISSWRWLFILEGLPAVVLGIIAFWMIQNSPAEVTWLSSSEKTWLIDNVQVERTNNPGSSRRSLTFFFSKMWFHRMWIAYFLEVCAGYSIIFWLPQIIHSLGFSGTNLEVGLVSAIPYVVALLCMLIWARHSDQTAERRYHLMIAWGCAAIGFFGDAIAPDALISLFFLILLTSGIYSGVPVFWAIVTERMNTLNASGGIALVNSLGTIGGFIGPSMMGLFVHTSGQVDAVPALLMFGCFMILSVLLITYNYHAKWDTPDT